MTWGVEHWVGLAVLAVATFALRLLGPWLAARIGGGARAESTDALLAGLAVAVLAGLVVTQSLFDGRDLVGWARPLGVVVAGLLVWRKAPFLVVVLAAAATTALVRLLGLS
ncbi:Branched-chain amino acid transport protein (AzlD) [Quadrisphaera granulorum]|uniref:Branched-subunit amino acid transport protein AzlD n=1 Tax=Quadrisphaera granulorum TaxID=317664 RepID=A0A316AEQ0_9ACTN|nr:AzlD domain-containing protein [Quadrisphaera granulorum]PWJ55839.1 branched-subunit amino acid transport protein AzlD [Quadrisphaera granulorum]SZE95336.1 Branched-chain amino acid transport protein (AzlD) [Quadrisphaera granulorum]